MTSEVKRLITHDGRFHADEVFSTAILTDLYPDAEVIRTRDESLITPAEGSVIYDVGGDYDEAKLIFDHHQNGAPKREDGNPFSSFGLIWRRFGAEWLAHKGYSADEIPQIALRFDRSVALEIDRGDNGLGTNLNSNPLHLSSIIEDMGPTFEETSSEKENECFMNAVNMVKGFISNKVRTISAKIKSDALMQKVFEEQAGQNFLVLPVAMPWEGALRKQGLDDVLFVIIPRKDGHWSISAVKKDAKGFENRKDLPKEWAGLRGDDLVRVSGIEDATFVHKALFYGAAKSKGGIMRMLEAALACEPEKEAEFVP